MRDQRAQAVGCHRLTAICRVLQSFNDGPFAGARLFHHRMGGVDPCGDDDLVLPHALDGRDEGLPQAHTLQKQRLCAVLRDLRCFVLPLVHHGRHTGGRFSPVGGARAIGPLSAPLDGCSIGCRLVRHARVALGSWRDDLGVKRQQDGHSLPGRELVAKMAGELGRVAGMMAHCANGGRSITRRRRLYTARLLATQCPTGTARSRRPRNAARQQCRACVVARAPLPFPHRCFWVS
mmetsp:Transcript_37870/g.95747  ORF Transcript_37870/g.95747 Transcript_37870/m.95747 type:complete len:235 (+) Transcript_37870:1029-1733(+)